MQDTQAEIDKLAAEAFTLQAKVVGTPPANLPDMVGAMCKDIFGKMEDELLKEHPDVIKHKPEVEQIAQNLAKLLQQLETVSKAVTSGFETAKDVKNKKAEEAATQAEQAKQEAAQATKAAEVVKPAADTSRRGRSTVVKATAACAAQGSASQSSGSFADFKKLALAKPIGDRNAEELLATCNESRSSKVRKTELAADDLLLANVA